MCARHHPPAHRHGRIPRLHKGYARRTRRGGWSPQPNPGKLCYLANAPLQDRWCQSVVSLGKLMLKYLLLCSSLLNSRLTRNVGRVLSTLPSVASRMGSTSSLVISASHRARVLISYLVKYGWSGFIVCMIRGRSRLGSRIRRILSVRVMSIERR